MSQVNIGTRAVALRMHCREPGGKRGSRETGWPADRSGAREEGEADRVEDLSQAEKAIPSGCLLLLVLQHSEPQDSSLNGWLIEWQSQES